MSLYERNGKHKRNKKHNVAQVHHPEVSQDSRLCNNPKERKHEEWGQIPMVKSNLLPPPVLWAGTEHELTYG